MAKNTGKGAQKLSPENYIRKKARTLPIYECMVNEEWEDSRMVQLSVARQHTNGNVSACFYLVDLMCLGVKDTHFLFNATINEYREQYDRLADRMSFIPISYELAHNLVYASHEYAEEYGFNPHKDFRSTTRFMLEEDTDDVELIEIECGMNGKPTYMRGPFDDNAKVKRITAQLEKTAGRGNYIIMDADQDFMEDEFEDEYYDDKLNETSFDEKKELFLDLSSRINNLNEEEQRDIGSLVNLLIDELVDIDLHNKYYDELFEPLNIKTSEDGVAYPILGVNKEDDNPVFEELKNRVLHIYKLIFNNQKQAKKELKKFKKENKELPAVYFLELLYLQITESRKFNKHLKEYATKYPDYSLIKLMWATEQVLSGKNSQEINGYPFAKNTVFAGRETIYPIEYHYFLTLHLFLISQENNLNKLEAFASMLSEFDLDENEYEILEAMISVIKISQLITHLKE